MEYLNELLENPLIKLALYLIGGVGAYLLAVLSEKYRNKQIIIEYTKEETPIGLSNYGGVWGDIEVKHNGILMGNMTLYSFVIENISDRDLSTKLSFRFTSLNGSEILSFVSMNEETGEIINLDSDFSNKHANFYERADVTELLERLSKKSPEEVIQIPNNIQLNADFFAKNKIFSTEIFNRKTSITFSFLIGNKDIQKTNAVEFKLNGKGVKFKEKLDLEESNKKVALNIILISLLIYQIQIFYLYNTEISKEISIIILGISILLTIPISCLIYVCAIYIKKTFFY